MKVNEIFESIQGEGRYAGYPVLFIRLSGCNKNCDFCDTKYHRVGNNMSVNTIVEIIERSNKKIIVWTGGEPLLQAPEIEKVIKRTFKLEHHVETNGSVKVPKLIFSYVCFSPKCQEDIDMIKQSVRSRMRSSYDIKLVTDGQYFNKDLISQATMLMPLTDLVRPDETRKNEQRVWEYCTKHNKRFCLRQHLHVWGTQIGR